MNFIVFLGLILYIYCDSNLDLFESFISEYNKEYTQKEKKNRFNIFQDNLKIIEDLNSKWYPTTTYGISKFTDLTEEEFLYQTGCLGIENGNPSCYKPPESERELKSNPQPEDVDWRKKGAVTRVKDQGICGSCWDFSGVGCMEGAYFLRTGELVEFSEQQVLDCITKEQCQGCMGCGGGFMNGAFRHAIEVGMEMEDVYTPYAARVLNCTYDEKKVKANFTRCHDLGSESSILSNIDNQPISVAIDSRILSHYTSGVITQCTFKSLTHAVLIVGYYKSGANGHYIVKNSWKQDWGEDGYFRMMAGVNCIGVGKMASLMQIDL